MQLNLSKCKTLRIEETRESGLEILATMVASESARRVFLNKKFNAQIAKLQHLCRLHRFQSSFLIFRTCYQQDLRHLQRSLHTSDLGAIGDRLDTAYPQIIASMRSLQYRSCRFGAHLPSGQDERDGELLSHRECSVYA